MAANAPGKSTLRMAKWRRVARVVLGLAALCLLFLVALNGLKATTVMGLVSCVFGMLGVERVADQLIDKVECREKRAVRGAEAEKDVGAILNRLSDCHRVLHDVESESGNMDHLVFRSDGAIFLIETKSHQGTVSVENGELRRDGRRFEKNFIKQTLGNTTWLKRFLKERYRVQEPWIHAVVVFTNAYVQQHCELHNVAVIHQSYLKCWMSKQSAKPEQAKKLWPRMDLVEAELFSGRKKNRVLFALRKSVRTVRVGIAGVCNWLVTNPTGGRRLSGREAA